jgi:Tfp pilus assembly protein PilE
MAFFLANLIIIVLIIGILAGAAYFGVRKSHREFSSPRVRDHSVF